MRIVGLGGGIGASRLWVALAAAVPATDLTVVVNTADDLWHHGLRICPDLDTTLYALSGRQDRERGWGVRGETWQAMDAMRELGQDVWFNLGDRDLATHLVRTGMLRDGRGLAEVTETLTAAMGVGVRVLPMTEDEVATTVEVADGRVVHYEEFLIQMGAAVDVVAVRHEGAAQATPAPGVLDAVAAADVVVIAPSNPVASVAPILSVPGIREAVAAAPDVVAVAPIVTRVPVGPGEQRRADSRARLLGAVGVVATATGVAGYYGGLVHRFVLDVADVVESEAVAAHGPAVTTVGTLLHCGDDAAALVAAVVPR